MGWAIPGGINGGVLPRRIVKYKRGEGEVNSIMKKS
jgi:hypothetical protein